jgi:hypothetical protein
MPINDGYKSRSIGTNLTAGSANTVYECPSNWTAHMVLLFVTNHGSGNKTLTIEWYDSSTSTWYYILGGYTLNAYGYLMLADSYLVLNAGDKMRITPEAGSSMSATVTVEEYFDPANRA